MRAREAAVALALVCAAALSVAAPCVGTGQKPGGRDARTLRGTSSAEVGDGVEERLTDLGISHQREEHESSEGVEGAAYTVVMMMETAAALDPVEPVEMRLDRPFLYGIRSQEGGWLFLGVVRDPFAG